MTVAILWIVAVLFMVSGHIFKVKRWGLFISVYEEPSEANLLNAMTFGHTLNAVLPFRIGDIVRAVWAGRKIKNGYSFSIATVLADLFVDVLTVGCMFFGLSIIGKGGDRLLAVAYKYAILFAAVLFFLILSIPLRRYVKRIIRILARIFNEKIEFRILYISYLCITSLKDIVQKINKAKFIFFSLGIWCSYIISYVIFAEAVQRYGFYYTTSDIFTLLFSGTSLYKVEKGLILLWGAYLLSPLLICGVISFIIGRDQITEENFHMPLPHMNQSDRMAFLNTYYEDEKREHIQSYLKLNRDVTVIEDKSAGSNASTLLIMNNDGNMLYRKYAFDEDGLKLQEQIDWIEAHQKDIPLPIIVKKESNSNYVSYDMHSYSSAVGLFRYIHTMPVEASWSLLEKALEDMHNGLYEKKHVFADGETIEKYVDSKVIKNLEIIKNNDRYIKDLEEFQEIVVNGKHLHTLDFYREMLEKNHMTKIFENDFYTDIHGDLTVENIVCITDNEEIDYKEYEGLIKPVRYYFIDANTGNVHDSPFLDYAKLLQSLHGNYEFLMSVNDVKIECNKVNYFMSKSEAYSKIYKLYKDYLYRNFVAKEVLSIYYHEVVHWIRLIPYKIRKNKKLAVVFYTGLLAVLNDVWEMEKNEKKQISYI